MVIGNRELDPTALLVVGLFVVSAGLVQTIMAVRVRRRFRPRHDVDVDGMFANPDPEPPLRDPRTSIAEDPGRWFMLLVFGVVFTVAGTAAVVKAVLDLLR